jgi:non-ribosomal peptide synthetase component F
MDGGGVAARLDLEVFLAEAEDGSLAGTLVYAADQFEPPTMARLARDYRAVLEAAVADPRRRISGLARDAGRSRPHGANTAV